MYIVRLTPNIIDIIVSRYSANETSRNVLYNTYDTYTELMYNKCPDTFANQFI